MSHLLLEKAKLESLEVHGEGRPTVSWIGLGARSKTSQRTSSPSFEKLNGIKGF
jgi:hypothetical protein